MGMEMNRVAGVVAEWAERNGIKAAGQVKKLETVALEAAEQASRSGGDVLHEAMEAVKRAADELKLAPSKKGIPSTLRPPEPLARQSLEADLRSLKIDGVTPDAHQSWLMGHADIPPEQTGMIFTDRQEYSVVYDKAAGQVRLKTGNELRPLTQGEQQALRERLQELLQTSGYQHGLHPVWKQEKGVIEEIAGALGLR